HGRLRAGPGVLEFDQGALVRIVHRVVLPSRSRVRELVVRRLARPGHEEQQNHGKVPRHRHDLTSLTATRFPLCGFLNEPLMLPIKLRSRRISTIGELAEWSNAAALKTASPE